MRFPFSDDHHHHHHHPSLGHINYLRSITRPRVRNDEERPVIYIYTALYRSVAFTNFGRPKFDYTASYAI